jgi:integrase/recombinase XerD
MVQFGSVKGQEPANKGEKYPPQVLTTDEVQAIIAGCSAAAPTGIRNRALLMLLYRSGLRVAEAVGDDRRDIPPLKVSDVSLSEHSIRVLHGKGDVATTRGFHLSATDAVARWIDTRKAMGIRGPLFCTLRGSPLRAQYVRLMLHRLAAEAGVEKRVTPHGLRHTYAAELETAGVPVTQISKLLGHSSIAVTHRYLSHLTNREAIAALQAVDLPHVDA